GDKSAGVMSEIASSDLLREAPYIEFVALNLNDVSPAVWDGRATAAGAILMPEFTPTMYAAAYRDFTAWRKGASLTVGRYYPREFDGTKLRDFPHIPFHDPEGIVMYVSEFLLGQASEQVRALHAQWRAAVRGKWIFGTAWAAACLAIAFLVMQPK